MRHLRQRQVADVQPLLLRVAHGVGGAAGGLRQVAQAVAAVVHQMAVALLHAAVEIVVGGVDHLVGLRQDVAVDVHILRIPTACLLGTGKHEDEADLRAHAAQPQHALRGESVEPERAARAEVAHAPRGEAVDLGLQPPAQKETALARQVAVTGETTGF